MGIEGRVGVMGRNEDGVRAENGFGEGWVGNRGGNRDGIGFGGAGDGVRVGMRL